MEFALANGITHSPERRTKRCEAWIPTKRSRKPPLDVARPRATFVGVKENFCSARFAGVSPAEANFSFSGLTSAFREGFRLRRRRNGGADKREGTAAAPVVRAGVPAKKLFLVLASSPSRATSGGRCLLRNTVFHTSNKA